MIERSSNIDHSYQIHTHEHMVTECIHEEAGPLKTEVATSTNEDKTEQVQTAETEQTMGAFSFRDMLSNGIRGVISKAVRLWNDTGEKIGSDTSAASAEKIESDRSEESILATTVLRNGSPRKEEADFEEENARKVSDIEGAVSGGLKKEQGNLRWFLQKFEKTVFGTSGIRKRVKGEKSTSEVSTDIKAVNHSYLLDSYNKSGEYSTLAKDRSLDGNFKAKV
ncbi:MAG: hypothetical protein GX235_10880 [Clostridiales bacterium]|nr:hypothetical protein [Clostridiales bacterium]